MRTRGAAEAGAAIGRIARPVGNLTGGKKARDLRTGATRRDVRPTLPIPQVRAIRAAHATPRVSDRDRTGDLQGHNLAL